MQLNQRVRAEAEAQDYKELVSDEPNCTNTRCHIIGALILAFSIVGIITIVVVYFNGS